MGSPPYMDEELQKTLIRFSEYKSPFGSNGIRGSCYAIKSGNNPVLFMVGGACYGELDYSNSFKGNKWAIFPMANQGRDEDRRFLRWVAEESPWARLVFNKWCDDDADFIFKHGFIFDQEALKNIPANLLVNSLTAARVHLSEEPTEVTMWARLVDAGVDPHVAFFFSQHWGLDANGRTTDHKNWNHAALNCNSTLDDLQRWWGCEPKVGVFSQMASESLKYRPMNMLWNATSSAFCGNLSADFTPLFKDVAKSQRGYGGGRSCPTLQQLTEICLNVTFEG